MNTENERPISASEYEFKNHIAESGNGETVSPVNKDSRDDKADISNINDNHIKPEDKKYTDAEFELSSLPSTSDTGVMD